MYQVMKQSPWRAYLVLWALWLVPLVGMAQDGALAKAIEAYDNADDRLARTLLESQIATGIREGNDRSAVTLAAKDQLVRVLLRESQFEAAEALAAEVLKVRETTLGATHPDTLTSKGRWAEVLGTLGRLREAASIANEVWRMSVQALGERHRVTLSALHSQAAILSSLGRPSEALSLAEQAYKLRKEVLGASHPDTLVSMGLVASTVGALGRADDLLGLSEARFRLAKQAFPPGHPAVMSAMTGLASAQASTGNRVESLRLLEDVAKTRQKISGADHSSFATALSNLAEAYLAKGDAGDALALYQRVFEIRKKVLGAEHLATLASVRGMARAYGALGRNADALAQLEQVLPQVSRSFGPRHPVTWTVMADVARQLDLSGQLERAAELTKNVVAGRTEVLGPRHVQTLRALNGLAMLHRRAGRVDEAIGVFEALLKAGEERPDGISRLDMASWMHNLSVAYRAKQRYQDERDLLEKVVNTNRELLGVRHPDTLGVILELAVARFRAGDRQEAVALARDYVAGAEAQRSQVRLTSSDRQSLFARYATGYRVFAMLMVSVGKTADALRLLEMGKGRSLLDNLTHQMAISTAGLPAHEGALIKRLEEQGAQLDEAFAEAQDAQSRLQLDLRRSANARELEALKQRLRSAYPKYALASTPKLVNPQGLMDAQSVAINYMVTPIGTAAFVVTDRKFGVRNFGQMPRLADAVEALRRGASYPRGLRDLETQEGMRVWQMADGSFTLQQASDPSPANAQPITDTAPIAAYLSDRLLKPLLESLDGKKVWVISPDGPLASLPFDLLPVNGKRAAEVSEIHYTQSFSVYSMARTRQAAYRDLQRPRELLAVGDPEYESTDSSPTSRTAAMRKAIMAADERMSRQGQAIQWQALPGTRREVESLQRLFPGLADTLLGTEASEEALMRLQKSGQLRNYRYLHFAVHGNLSSADPSLSSLVMTQTNLAPGTDGYITAAEWPVYDLRSDITVLSACETGLGRNLQGEGVLGLPFSLFLAGNVNTVLTLWPVDDDATADFMKHFFGRLKEGMTASGALTDAKRVMMRSPRYSNPRYWAPFILVGAG